MARTATPAQHARRRANGLLDLQGARLLMAGELAALIEEHPARYGRYGGLLAHWRGPLAAAERALQRDLEADLTALDGRCAAAA